MTEGSNSQGSKVFLYSVMVGMLLTGSANTLIQKYQNDTIADDNYFTHPYFQTAIMFSGELAVFLAYGVKKLWIRKQIADHPEKAAILLSPGTQEAGEKQLKTNPSPLLLAIPASCDFLGSTLMFIALTMVPASVYQMMRGFINVVTPFLSIIFLKKKQYMHHWLGVVAILLGVAEVGVIAIMFEDSEEEAGATGSVTTGIILILISQLFTGTMFIVEEYFIGDYYLDPMKVVGTEGMWGLCYYLALLPVMQAIQCDPSNGGLQKLCNFGYLENSSYAFLQMSENYTIIWLSLGMMLSIACFNVCGITTTKEASAAQRATIDTSRTLVIWIMSCALGLEPFNWQAIFGFILLVFGTLVYNEILVLPFWGLDQNTKEKIEAREAKAKRDADYTGASPAAPYGQASRNKRLLQKENDKHYNQVHDGDENDFDMRE